MHKWDRCQLFDDRTIINRPDVSRIPKTIKSARWMEGGTLDNSICFTNTVHSLYRYESFWIVPHPWRHVNAIPYETRSTNKYGNYWLWIRRQRGKKNCLLYTSRARRAGECYTLKNFWCKKKKLNNDRQKRDSEKTARLQASGCNVNVKVVEHQDNNELDQKREGKQRKSLLTRNYSKHRRGAFLLHTAEENDLEWRDDWRKIDNRLCAEWGASSNMKDRHNEELVNCKFVELSSNQRIDVKRTKGVWEEKSFWNNKCNLIVGAPRRGRCSGSKFSDILATGPSRSMLTFEWRGVC